MSLDFVNCMLLPAEFLSFEIELNASATVNIRWSTYMKQDSIYFTVLKSSNGCNWKEVSTVNGHGFPDNILNYSVIDSSPGFGTIYYKLKKLDFEGNSVEGPIRSVFIPLDNVIKVYPNPFAKSFRLVSNDILGSVEVFNDFGILVFEIKSFEKEIEIDSSFWLNGVYILKNKNQTLKLVKL